MSDLKERIAHTCAQGDHKACPACIKAHADPHTRWGDCRCLLCWECTR